MEGDGPLNGTQRELNTLVLSDDPVAADSCVELLGLGLDRARYVAEAGRFLGNISRDSIDHLAGRNSEAKTPDATFQSTDRKSVV